MADLDKNLKIIGYACDFTYFRRPVKIVCSASVLLLPVNPSTFFLGVNIGTVLQKFLHVIDPALVSALHQRELGTVTHYPLGRNVHRIKKDVIIACVLFSF